MNASSLTDTLHYKSKKFELDGEHEDDANKLDKIINNIIVCYGNTNIKERKITFDRYI